MTTPTTPTQPTIWYAILPIVFLVLMLTLTVYLFGSDATGGAVQIVLILATGLTGVLAARRTVPYKKLQQGIIDSVTEVLPAIFMLLLIGALSGTWMLSGIVPTIIYYGLQLINPSVFLCASCLIASIISLATGSSWSTIATVGVALLGIGNALGIEEGMVAGAIISGAYFGDKVSPLSETTNLAAAVAGTPLFTHIRYMLHTTVPSIVITLLIFLSIGLFDTYTHETTHEIATTLRDIDDVFFISPWLLLVPVLVIGMIIYRVDTIPVLLTGALLGGVVALCTQPTLVALVSGETGDNITINMLAKGVINALSTEVNYHTKNDMLNKLLNTHGMAGMLQTVWLILCAMSFGGMLQATGFLQVISDAILKRTRKSWSIISSTTGTCIVSNLVTADQYLSIVVPGKIFAKGYQKEGLQPEVLSRTLEDSATVTSVLVPWNTCGATQASVLGVATLAYAPFCFFNLISPCMTLIFAVLGFRIRRTAQKKEST